MIPPFKAASRATVYKQFLVQGKSCYPVPMKSEAAFAALAEPRRRAMLLLVRDRPRAVNEIAAHFDISQQAVSQHLQVLKDAGLVAVRPEGQRRLYVVRPEGLEAVRGFLAEFWPETLDRLKSDVESRKRSGR
jgi:DNA-binding transcriptional ArsR family regulator